jgi:excisionase family DNA binding protein
MEREIWAIKQVAFYLRINPKTVYELVNSGELPGFKVGGSWRFKKADIKQWVDERKKLWDNRLHHPKGGAKEGLM